AINDYIDQKKLEHSEKNHKQVREGLRLKYGKEALAILNEKKISQLLKKEKILIIDGMRSWEEYEYLMNRFPRVRIVIVALFADKLTRYYRISHRKDRARLFGAQRDLDELFGTNMGPTIAYADHLVKNNFSIEDFFDKLEIIYRTIYFS
ncbi:hypothetical protein COS12_00130, partial [Candidatus Roizmanbacteria bacterium CG01_land_8_20_14_3_00_33_9]